MEEEDEGCCPSVAAAAAAPAAVQEDKEEGERKVVNSSFGDSNSTRGDLQGSSNSSAAAAAAASEHLDPPLSSCINSYGHKFRRKSWPAICDVNTSETSDPESDQGKEEDIIKVAATDQPGNPTNDQDQISSVRSDLSRDEIALLANVRSQLERGVASSSSFNGLGAQRRSAGRRLSDSQRYFYFERGGGRIYSGRNLVNHALVEEEEPEPEEESSSAVDSGLMEDNSCECEEFMMPIEFPRHSNGDKSVVGSRGRKSVKGGGGDGDGTNKQGGVNGEGI